MIDYAEYFRKDGTQDRELIDMIDKAYQQGRAEERVKVLERVKQRLITYSVGDEVIIDFNSLFDELSEIKAEE